MHKGAYTHTQRRILMYYYVGKCVRAYYVGRLGIGIL